MINWKNPKEEVPASGEIVVCVTWHWKKTYPSSMEIMAGEVNYASDGASWRVETNDSSGHGSYCVYGEEIKAWCFASEFFPFFPSFLEMETSLVSDVDSKKT